MASNSDTTEAPAPRPQLPLLSDDDEVGGVGGGGEPATVKVALTTALSLMPDLLAKARSVVVAVMVNALAYTAEDPFGVLPSVV